MAYVYKRSTDRRWRFQYRDGGRTIDKKGLSSRRETELMAARLEDDVIRIRNGLLTPGELKRRDAEAKPLSEHLSEWRAYLLSVGNRADYCELCYSRVSKIFSMCASGRGIHRISQIDAAEVQGVIKSRMDSGHHSQQTCNHHITMARGFCRWLHLHDRAPDDKLKLLKKYALTQIKHERAPIAAADMLKMITHVEAMPDNSLGGQFKIRGRDRAMLYRIAWATGLRRRSLCSLTPESFCLKKGEESVKVPAAYSKNKRTIVIPLSPEMAEMLADYLKYKPEKVRLWDVPMHSSRVIKMDFKRAGVVFPDDGRFRDFHALRGTAITTLLSAGAHLRTAQQFAGHSNPSLTSKYAPPDEATMRAAVSAVGSIAAHRAATQS